MEFVLPLVWVYGVTFSMDEMTMRLKGHHAEKIFITYKTEGYGLQTDAIFRKNTHIELLFETIMCHLSKIM